MPAYKSIFIDPIPKPNTQRFPRTDIRTLSREDNKLNAWATKVTVQDIDRDIAVSGPLAGKRIVLKVIQFRETYDKSTNKSNYRITSALRVFRAILVPMYFQTGSRKQMPPWSPEC